MCNTTLDYRNLNITQKPVKCVIPFTFFSHNTKCCLLKLLRSLPNNRKLTMWKNLLWEAVIIVVWKDEEAVNILLPTYFISVHHVVVFINRLWGMYITDTQLQAIHIHLASPCWELCGHISLSSLYRYTVGVYWNLYGRIEHVL